LFFKIECVEDKDYLAMILFVLGLPKAPILLRKIGFFLAPIFKSKLLTGRNKKPRLVVGAL
jgi:hypothetical protein